MANPENNVAQIAQKIAYCRPLTPFPGWRFNIDWDNQSPGFPERRALWQHGKDRGLFAKVVIPWHHGTRLELVLSNDVSQQVFIGGCIEPNEMAFLERFLHPGMTFVDVGANEGLFSLLGAAKVGPTGTVWAFEPSPREFRQLTANKALNPTLPLELFEMALANKSGTAQLKVAEPTHAGQNTLGEFGYPIGTASTELVSLRRLDDLVAERKLTRLDLLKIDVEGAESAVIEGARKTLGQYRPVILLEVLEKALKAQKSSPIHLLNLLRGLDYRFLGFSAETGLETLWETDVSPLPSDNILAWPREKPFPPSQS